MPGKVSRTKLLELSARIGVGPSLAFLRKQRGLRALLSRGSAADRLQDALAPALADPEFGIAGFHIFTFNQLLETWRWQHARDERRPDRARGAVAPAPHRLAAPENEPA
jgi:methylenetetrahydrofolate reductase (NADPH)